jgi:hypothetical protein
MRATCCSGSTKFCCPEHPGPVTERAGRQAGDLVYVFPLSRIGVLFYGPRYGLERKGWTTGICDRNDTRAYIRDVDRYRGASRVWVLSLGARPFRVAGRQCAAI